MSKKIIAMVLAVMLAVQLVGCTSPSTTSSSDTTVKQTDSGELEPATFELMYVGNGNGLDYSGLKIVKDYEAERADQKVHLAWKDVGTYDTKAEKINILFSSGTYSDAFCMNGLTESDVSKLSAQKLLIPLEDYITKENTPNLYKFFEKVPSAKAISTSPDGHIYSLPSYYGNAGSYLESPIWINKTWLDKLNLKIPTTIEEFHDVLLAFKTQDPNGNGKADEIPYIARNGSSMSHLEAMLGIWGISTKDNMFDSYITVRDGKVKFAPALPEYKEALKYLKQLYSEGLINQDVFTVTAEDFTAKMNSEETTIGVFTSKTADKHGEEYIQIMPPKADGYNLSWFYHPGALGVKNYFSITDKCSDPVRLLKFMDGWFEAKQSMINCYGPIGEVLAEDKNGLLTMNEVPGGLSMTEYQINNTLNSQPMFLVYEEDFGKVVELTETDKTMQKSYDMYKDIITKEIWPRPFLDEESTTRASELRTDIFNTVSQMKAKWITGQTDIDAEWDTYLSDLDKMGIEEFVELYQKAYDQYVSAGK